MGLLAIKAELHIFDEEVGWAHPLRLQLLFPDGTALRLRIPGDGEGLILDRLPLEPPMDLEEYGRTGIFDITDRLDPALRRCAAGDPLAVRNAAGRLVGLALPGRDREPFCIWINMDEFRWGSPGALAEDYWPDETTPVIAGPLPLPE